jgi:hypothetical protein
VSTQLDLGFRPDGERLELPLEALDRHAQIIGPTGSGKTRLLMRLVQELSEKSESCIVVLDPKGNMYRFLRRWCYQEHLDHRVLLIDPNDRRMVCGFNPVQPWPDNHDLQARVGRALLLRAMGQQQALATPLMSRWLDNVLHSLIETRLTLVEALPLLHQTSNEFRSAILPRLSPSPARDDLQGLVEMVEQRSQSQARRLALEQVGSSYNRFRELLGNPALRAMYGTTHSIDWASVINNRTIVLVNLQPRELDPEAQRLLGLQIVSEISRDVFRRTPAEKVPTYLVIDEAGLFITPDLMNNLDMGRELGLHLILSHQFLSQFIEPATGDRRLLDSVLNDARVKIVFGGLADEDADKMARELFRHHMDPDKVQLELHTLRQLSEVVTARTVTVGVARSTGHVSGAGHVSGSGESSGRMSGSASSFGSGFGMTTGEQYPLADPSAGVSSRGMIHSDSSSRSSSDGESDSTSYMEADSDFEAESTSVAESLSITEGQQVRPGPVFSELSSVQLESLDVQLQRFASALVLHPDRNAFLAVGKASPPVGFQVAQVDEPAIDEDQALFLDLQLMRTRDCYSEPQAIELEIAERQAALLPPAAPVVEDLPAVFDEPPVNAPRKRAANKTSKKRST